MCILKICSYFGANCNNGFKSGEKHKLEERPLQNGVGMIEKRQFFIQKIHLNVGQKQQTSQDLMRDHNSLHLSKGQLYSIIYGEKPEVKTVSGPFVAPGPQPPHPTLYFTIILHEAPA